MKLELIDLCWSECRKASVTSTDGRHVEIILQGIGCVAQINTHIYEYILVHTYRSVNAIFSAKAFYSQSSAKI